MAEIEVELTKFLSEDERLTALIGDRFWHLPLPQAATLPAVTYSRVTTENIEWDLEGPTGNERPFFQFDAWSPVYDETLEVTRALRDILDGFRGWMGEIWVEQAKVEDVRDLFEPDPQTEHRAMRVMIWHRPNQ